MDIPDSGAATFTYTVTGLSNGTTYTFELRAIRGVDTEGLAAGIEPTPTATGPAAPAGLTATPGVGRITQRWTDPENDQISRYQYRQRESGGTWSDWADIEGSGANTTTYTVTGLTYGIDLRCDKRSRHADETPDIRPPLLRRWERGSSASAGSRSPRRGLRMECDP